MTVAGKKGNFCFSADRFLKFNLPLFVARPPETSQGWGNALQLTAAAAAAATERSQPPPRSCFIFSLFDDRCSSLHFFTCADEPTREQGTRLIRPENANNERLLWPNDIKATRVGDVQKNGCNFQQQKSSQHSLAIRFSGQLQIGRN